MLTFDDLTWAGGLVFDDLNDSAVVAITQQGDVTITLSADSSQSVVGVVEQIVDIEMTLYSDAGQEWVAPAAAVAYLQSGNVQIILFASAGQEHVPAFGGIYGQSGNVTLALSANATQLHLQGAAPGDWLQQADAAITLVSDAVQVWNPSAIGGAGYASVGTVAGYAAANPTILEVTLNPVIAEAGQVTVEFNSGDSDWLVGVGPQGGLLACSLELNVNGAWVPLASLSHQYPRASFVEGDAFDALAAAAATGSMSFRLGGFEADTDRVVPRTLYGGNLLAVEAYT